MLSRCYSSLTKTSTSYSSIYLLQVNDKFQQNRNYHLSTKTAHNLNKLNTLQINKNQLINVSTKRYASTTDSINLATSAIVGGGNTIKESAGSSQSIAADTSSVNDSITFIPDAPPIPAVGDHITSGFDTIENIVQALPPGVEASFASIGLGGWTPVGMVQNCLEFVHVTCDIPWWGTIAIGTLVVRTILLPLVILSQRNSAKMNNNLPQMQLLQLKMSEARQSGNQLESARYAQEMVQFMKEKDVNPLKNLLVPIAQAPVFISFFIGLRKMANTPVESMREGGLFWFTDLTLADPYFLLPALTSFTLFLTIELGTDSAKLSSQNMQTMRYVLRALPLIIFPFTMNFPAGILVYWASSNFISLVQVGILRLPGVRDYFKIERAIVHKSDTLPMQPKPFIKGIKDSWQNIKITKELEERQRIHEMTFKRAGKGPLIKTYKHDPTTVQESTSSSSVPTSSHAAIQAKKR